MKTLFKSLVAATAGALLLAASVSATEVTAWTQVGFTIDVSSGTLNVTPAGTLNDASTLWHNPAEPFSGSAAATTLDGYAFASSGSSTAISTSLNGGNYFLVDAFALTDDVATASGRAAAAALAFYDLTFSNVIGASVVLTLTPVFYASSIGDSGNSFGYVSSFLSLGTESFISYQDSGGNAGLADFTPITLTVGAGETVALNVAVSAGTGVPDTANTLGLVLLGFGALVGLQRRFAPKPAGH